MITLRGVSAKCMGVRVARDSNDYPYTAVLWHLSDGTSSSEAYIDEALLDEDNPTESYFITVAELSPYVSAIKEATDMKNNMARYPLWNPSSS